MDLQLFKDRLLTTLLNNLREKLIATKNLILIKFIIKNLSKTFLTAFH